MNNTVISYYILSMLIISINISNVKNSNTLLERLYLLYFLKSNYLYRYIYYMIYPLFIIILEFFLFNHVFIITLFFYLYKLIENNNKNIFFNKLSKFKEDLYDIKIFEKKIYLVFQDFFNTNQNKKIKKILNTHIFINKYEYLFFIGIVLNTYISVERLY